MRQTPGKSPFPFWPLIIFIVFATGVLLRAHHDERSFHRSEALQVSQTLQFLDALVSPAGGVVPFIEKVFSSEGAPVGTSLLQLPAYILLDRMPGSYLLLNLLLAFFVVLLTYRIGLMLYGRSSGILALLLLLTMLSFVYYASRPSEVFPVLTFTIAFLAAALSSEHLTRRKARVFMGISLFLGLLCSPAFLIYIVGPFSVFVLECRRRFKASGQDFYKNIIQIFAIGMIPALPWYIFNIQDLANLGMNSFTIAIISTTTLLQPIINLWNFDIHGALIPLVILWIGLSIRDRDLRRLAFPFVWLVVPVIIFSLLPWKDTSLLLPALPGLAILAASGLTSLERISHKVGLVALTLMIQFAGMYNVYFEAELPLSGFNRNKPTFSSEKYAPFSHDWALPRIANEIASSAALPIHRPASVAILADLDHFNQTVLNTYLACRNVDANMIDLGKGTLENARNHILTTDFLVLKDSYQGDESRTLKFHSLEPFLNEQTFNKRQIAAYNLPDGSMAWLLEITRKKHE